MSQNTPQTQKEFIDYRFNETNDNIAAVQKTVGAIQNQLSNAFATKDYVNVKDKELEERIKSLESDRQWFVRGIIGAVIVGLITAYLQIKS